MCVTLFMLFMLAGLYHIPQHPLLMSGVYVSGYGYMQILPVQYRRKSGKYPDTPFYGLTLMPLSNQV